MGPDLPRLHMYGMTPSHLMCEWGAKSHGARIQ